MSWHELAPASAAVTRIHVVSKTHLDIGYTDQPDAVVAAYLDNFLPAAIHLNERLTDSERPEKFVWTTGSWLIWEALERAQGAQLSRLERAIADGSLVWHGLPFTFHSELMTADLVRAGLKLSARLDQRFNKKTVAAKLTDVPGHTRSLVPLLAEAGIEFLHIGGNGGITPPDLPGLFHWVDEGTSTSVTVMYHDDYGGFSSPAGTSSAIDIAVTQDNDGPPTLLQHVARIRAMCDRYPAAEVVASTLDAFWGEISHIQPDLPRVSSEIGDSWIYGGASDPQKLRDFRALSRLHSRWSREDPGNVEIERFGQKLSLVAEHTWGLDTIVHMPSIGYANDALVAARAGGRLDNFERSWNRQRRYLADAMESLSDSRRATAVAYLAPRGTESSIAEVVARDTHPHDAAQQLGVDPTSGELVSCIDPETGREMLGAAIGQVSYQIYGRQAFANYLDHYVKPACHNEWWVGRAFGKHELELDGGIRQWLPTVTAITHFVRPEGPASRVDLAFNIAEDSGAPEVMTITYFYVTAERRVDIQMEWPAKHATLLPEAMWVRFHNPLHGSTITVRKLGRDVDIHDIVRSGGGVIHATDGLVHIVPAEGDDLVQLRTIDAALVSVGDNRLLGDGGAPAPLGADLHVNLFNNLWGTNFPLWIEGQSAFRFEWSLRPSSTPVGSQP